MPPTKVSHTTAEAASRVVAGPRRQVGVTTRGWWAERAGRQQAFPALAKASQRFRQDVDDHLRTGSYSST